ncbi:MAG: FKBP-type peptidyl-prolyl cis-trans isomerase [Lachnospiraceae bacterium]|nr:FKBP-type peptidyl-prolyl cis-trans isomerase [Lachnospiraceae bacterium]MBP5255011.1 FKBP-type peptidyl-prolyl cis-trans isomerase [Lachnospiraceae bacterium]
MKNRVWALLLAGAVLMGSLAGCGLLDAAKGSETAAPSYATADLDYSYLLTDNGFVEGVKALDHVTLPDFSSISFQKKDLFIDDEQVDRYVHGFITNDNGTGLIPVDKTIESGDQVRISYVGRMDGEAFQGGSTGEDGTIVEAGSKDYIDDFLDQIIGHKAGETIDVEVTFPDPYPNKPEYAGKDAVFTTTIMQVLAEPEEFNDEYVLLVEEEIEKYFRVDGDTTTVFKTAESVRDYIRETMYESSKDDKIVDYLVEQMQLKEMPENVTKCVERYLNNFYQTNYDFTMDDLVEAGRMTREQVDKLIGNQSNYYLLVQAIAEKEGWKIEESDLQALVGASSDLREYVAWYGRGYLAHNVLFNRFWTFLDENIKVEE